MGRTDRTAGLLARKRGGGSRIREARAIRRTSRPVSSCDRARPVRRRRYPAPGPSALRGEETFGPSIDRRAPEAPRAAAQPEPRSAIRREARSAAPPEVRAPEQHCARTGAQRLEVSALARAGDDGCVRRVDSVPIESSGRRSSAGRLDRRPGRSHRGLSDDRLSLRGEFASPEAAALRPPARSRFRSAFDNSFRCGLGCASVPFRCQYKNRITP